MSNMKRRKRLNALALVFALVFLAGAAFAFVPGHLDVVGRVGLREGQYVQWILAATGANTVDTLYGSPIAPPTELNTLTQRNGFTHNMVTRTATVHGTPSISPTPPEVYLNHAHIITGDGVRERNNQRIEWSVIFNAAGEATLYVQAMNTSTLSHAYITDARVVGLTDVGVIAPLAANASGWMGDGIVPWNNDPDNPQAMPPGYQGLPEHNTLPVVSAGLNTDLSALVGQMFEISGSFDNLTGRLNPTNAANTINAASTGIETIIVEWNGDLNVLAGEMGITTWMWVDDYTDDAVDPVYWDDINWLRGRGGWVNTTENPVMVIDTEDGSPTYGEYIPDNRGITLLPTNAVAGEVFMTTTDVSDNPIALGSLEGWVGTFVIELDYELTAAP